MARVVIRCDGSGMLGFGHVARCIAFAQGMRATGLEAVFLTRRLEPRAAEAVRGAGFQTDEGGWPTASPEDLAATLALARQARASFVVTDLCHSEATSHYHKLRSYHAELRAKHFLVAFGDGRWCDLDADIVVSPYARRPPPQLLRGSGRFLTGPEYFVFLPEFIEAARRPRVVTQQAKRLLLTVGGSDPGAITLLALEALRLLADASLATTVVLGPAFSQELCANARHAGGRLTGPVTFAERPRSLASLLLEADLAVTGDGLTKYESAVTGTPSILIPRPDSDHELNDEFCSFGSALLAPPSDRLAPQELARTVRGVLDDPGRRQKMSERGRKMLDGRGVQRILAQLPSQVFA